MEYKLQRLGALTGIALMVLFGIGFALIAGLIPPPSPTASADEIATYLTDHKVRIRVGIAFVALTCVVAYPFLAVICTQVRRVTGRWGVLAITQVMAGSIVIPGFIFPMLVLGIATFRPETRPAEITLAFNDAFWILFVTPIGTLVMQALVLTLATFIDPRPVPVFPRWFGYFNAWVALLFVPGAAVVVFNDGPLAWNGVFAFWIPLFIFSAWIIVVSVVLVGAVKSEEAEEAAAVSS
jgi:hypothetical protein